MTEWPKVRIDEIGLDFGDAPFGTKLKTKDYVDEGVPVIQGRNIKNNRFEWNQHLYVTEEKFQSLKKSHCREGDLVFPKVGTIGVTAIMPKVEGRGTFLLSTNMMKMSVDPARADIRFVYHYFTQESVRSSIRANAGGSSQPIFNFTTLKRFEIPLPPLPVQRRIAGILSAYDELIENSQRRIRLLEDMARALYREWFVHFRFPGHESVPRLPSALGDIPQGWEVKASPECIDFNPRVTVPREGEKPFLPMGGLSTDSMIISDVESRTGNSGSKFQNGDTLFARITPCLENGKTGFVQFLPDASSVAFGSTEFIVMRSRTLTPEFVYCLARSGEFRGNAIKSMSGATGRQRVQEKCFDGYLICQPPKDLLKRFAAIVRPSFQLIHKLHLRIENLRRTRDLLLPRLLTANL